MLGSNHHGRYFVWVSISTTVGMLSRYGAAHMGASTDVSLVIRLPRLMASPCSAFSACMGERRILTALLVLAGGTVLNLVLWNYRLGTSVLATLLACFIIARSF
eukprot:6183394-Pleurochrysis_carterae.AAC.4